ncbi:unnamed protein product [Urochloa decumbens]|uniref:Uncharacterized protein n=1 Tax=Urochloa decumbens TaxID=240449 RepID=A0ABC9GQW2_9POAL
MATPPIDHMQFREIFHEHFCKDQAPIPPDVKTLQDFSAYLQYKSLCLVDGEEPDPAFTDTHSFMGQLTSESCNNDEDDEVTSNIKLP